MSLTISEAVARFEAGMGVTLSRETKGAGSREAGWQYATARRGDDGVAEYRGPGVNTWRPVSEGMAPDSPHSTPLRMLLRLVRGEAGKVTDADVRGTGVVLLPVRMCGKCGKLLATPARVREGYGPECGKRADERAARRAAKEAAMRNFGNNAAALHFRPL